jgi:nucleotide-binding universal stress UspA family protein
MKILLAIDESPCSEAAIDEVCKRPWPEASEVRVLTAYDIPVSVAPDPLLLYAEYSDEMLAAARERAEKLIGEAASRIRKENGKLPVSEVAIEGPAKLVIVEEAKRWNADLIIVGSHGYGGLTRFLLGSTSHAVVLHSPCSVEVVKC